MELFQRALIASKGKGTINSNIDVTVERPKKSPNKPIDRAKSRERIPRELPTQVLSSEDEGPCFIDLETPVDWIKTLSEQSNNGIITNSRKDLLNDHALKSDNSVSEEDVGKKNQVVKKKKKKKAEEKDKVIKKPPSNCTKIPANIKKIWKLITDENTNTLETILEEFDMESLPTACNTPDPNDGNTALHKAAIAAKPDMVTELLTAGGDPCIKNYLLQTPYAASPHYDTRVAFRLFQAKFPDKYNYNKSQIPGPVTPEQLEEEKERKAQQKRDKRQRDKEKQIEKNKTNKFLQMTDAEKVKADLRKCFLCATNLPKKPFEYEKYMFCSIRCLQNHRNLRPLHKTA